MLRGSRRRVTALNHEEQGYGICGAAATCVPRVCARVSAASGLGTTRGVLGAPVTLGG